MRHHPEIGERICGPLQLARGFAPIIRHHHERWDGRGYPDGLTGEGIPLGARIVAIADAFDAIFRGRLYRPARSLDESVAELRRHAGTQFDPGLVPLFIDEIDRVETGVPPAVELPIVAQLPVAIPIRPATFLVRS
jgi:response regulator RpfG family c-di-GMP phosphodiesterase